MSRRRSSVEAKRRLRYVLSECHCNVQAERVYNPPLTFAVDLNSNHSDMLNPPPYVPNVQLSDAISQFEHARNTMNLGTEVQRRAAELARRAEEDTVGIDIESDDDEGDGDYEYEDRRTRRDVPEEAVFFRREQDELEIGLIERRVAEATRVLEEAQRDLKEAKDRIRDRRREERRQMKERSVPVDDERARLRGLRAYLSPGGNRSRPPSAQGPLGLPPRSRSPSPYRFVSRRESDVEARSRSRTRSEASQEQVYDSFSKIHDLSREFQRLKQNYVYPTVIEFQKDGGEIISVRAHCDPEDETEVGEGPEGRVAYTRGNEGLHAYTHGMEVLLGKLDCVESWNETSVRRQRRGVVGEIEGEATKLERYRQRVWQEYLA